MTVTSVPVPDSLEQALSPHWLTAALQQRFPGVEVSAVVPGPVVDRISTNARFVIECTNGVPDGLATELCVKGYFNETGRAARYIGAPEAGFYRDLATRTGVRTLHSVYADIDPTTRHGVVITEDVVSQGGAFLDGNSPYTPDQTAVTLAEFAGLHAATKPWCVMHGDAHVGNLFLDADQTPSLVDWQLVQRGMWYTDVGYHIASTLTAAERRRSERDLLRHYLDALASRGVTPPPWDEAWRAIAFGVVHGFFLWGITTKVQPAVIAILLHRLGTAVADHDALSVQKQ